MSLFSKIKRNKSIVPDVFNKRDIINEILDTRMDNCPEWKLFRISDEPFMIYHDSKELFNLLNFDKINGDFLAIYTDVIQKEVRINSNPFTEYKNTVESIYQIVREVYITDEDHFDLTDNIYKIINARSAKELFIKLKKEQE